MKKKATTSLMALGLAAGFALLAGSAAAADVAATDGLSPWMFRLRGIYVMPDEKAHLTVSGNVDIGDAIVPELDISYFFTENLAAELILGTTNHEVDGQSGGLAGLNLGDVWLLPPTLTAQYHFNLTDTIKPYVGAGVNYTIFYGEDAGQFADIDYKNSFGWALQAGVDIATGDNWGINLDVKKLFLDTKVRVNNGVVTSGKVEIDPWIFGAGVYYRY
jgi:outer membrane protein